MNTHIFKKTYSLKYFRFFFVRYLETFSDGGFFQGRNLVFDKRESLAPPNYIKIGKCHICEKSWDRYEIDGEKMRCSQCRLLLLICPDCRVNHSKFICDLNECPAIIRKRNMISED